MNMVTAPAQPSPEYLITLLTDLGVTLFVETTGELIFNCPDHIRDDVEIILRSDGHRQILLDYLSIWRPLVTCHHCGSAITEQREDSTCIEVRLTDQVWVNNQAEAVCGLCNHPVRD